MIFKTETAVKRDAENFVLRYLDKNKHSCNTNPGTLSFERKFGIILYPTMMRSMERR